MDHPAYDDKHIRTYGYFETALMDYFQQKARREEAAQPCGFDEWEQRNEARLPRHEFDELSDAF